MPWSTAHRHTATYTVGVTSTTTDVGAREGSTADTRCPSCGAARPARFCAECGERRVDPDDYRLRHFAAHAVDQLFNLDGTLWRTGRALVTRPGLLTTEYLAGRRTRYTRPLQLFLLVNVAFFLLVSPTSGFRYPLAKYTQGQVTTMFVGDAAHARALAAAKTRREGITAAEFERRFDAASGSQQSVWLLTVPVFALLLAALYARWGRPFVHHLVFAVHFFAFLLLWVGTVVAGMLLLVLAARAVLPPLRGWAPELAHALARGLNTTVNSEAVMSVLIMGAVAPYLVVALRRVYPEALGWTVGRATVLALAMPWFAALYRDLLFALAYLSV